MSRSRVASLAAIFAVVFIDLLGFGIALPLLARYGERFDAEGWLGPLVAVFSAMQFLFAPLWGRLSDVIGRRPVLLIGLAGSAVCYSLFGFASGMAPEASLLGLSPLALLFVSRIGAGISGATIPTAQAYIADVTGPADRAKGMALIGAAFGMGFTFGPMIGAMFVSGDPEAAPSPYPGYLAAGLSALAFLAAFLVLREPERTGNSAFRANREGRFQLLRDGVRSSLIGMILLTTTAFALFESTLALLSDRLGYSDRANFLLFAYVGVTLTLTQGGLVRRLPPERVRRLVPWGLSLLASGLALLGIAGTGPDRAGWFMIGGLTLCVVGVSFVTPALQALLSLTTPGNQQGTVLGIGQSAAALARIIGQFGGIWLFQYSVPMSYGLAGALTLASLIAMIPVLATIRAREESTPGEINAPIEPGVKAIAK